MRKTIITPPLLLTRFTFSEISSITKKSAVQRTTGGGGGGQKISPKQASNEATLKVSLRSRRSFGAGANQRRTDKCPKFSRGRFRPQSDTNSYVSFSDGSG